MVYAIISPDKESPWGYYTSSIIPTLEELADFMAHATGHPDRDSWLIANHVELLGFAPVH